MDKKSAVSFLPLRNAISMKRSFIFVTTLRTSLLVALAGFLAGCATPKKGTTIGPKYIFYPAAPDEPRLQFLTSYETDRELRSGARDNFVTYLTGKQEKVIPILKPYGGVAGRGRIYVCDTSSSSILRMDLNEHRIHIISPTGPAAFATPVNLALDTNGWMYVVDVGREQLLILDQDEQLVGTFGKKGETKPRDVALTTDRIYLSDVTTHSVHVLDKSTRSNLFDIPRAEEKTNVNCQLFQPINIALDTQGRLYVSDFGAYRVQVYDVDGKHLRSIGKYGDNFGEFARPKGVAVDRENRVYVVETAGQHVQLFDDQGRLLMWFGEPGGSKVALELPAKVLLDYDDVSLFKKYAAPDFEIEHLVIVMNQYGKRKVSVFGFGHKK
jgi:sugar lactone lactonase YvrE